MQSSCWPSKDALDNVYTIFVVSSLFETKTAVTSDNYQRICHSILYAALINQLCKVVMDVATYYDAFCIGELIKSIYIALYIHLFV